MSDLNFADYENVIDYSFDFTSKRVDKDLERKIRLCFNKLSKNKKLPVFYLIIYHRYLNETKWYLQGQFYFHWLEIQRWRGVGNGLHWENGDYLHINLNQILQSFVLRNPGAVFYAKGKEKTEFLAKYLDRKIENLDDLGCPQVENLYFKNYPSCNKHIPHYNSRNHCALKKTKVFMIG